MKRLILKTGMIKNLKPSRRRVVPTAVLPTVSQVAVLPLEADAAVEVTAAEIPIKKLAPAAVATTTTLVAACLLAAATVVGGAKVEGIMSSITARSPRTGRGLKGAVGF